MSRAIPLLGLPDWTGTGWEADPRPVPLTRKERREAKRYEAKQERRRKRRAARSATR